MSLEFLRQFNLNPKKYATSFETADNKEEYDNILNMAHSTFDREKFEPYLQGNLNITTDGIASGFSHTNKFVIPNIDIFGGVTITWEGIFQEKLNTSGNNVAQVFLRLVNLTTLSTLCTVEVSQYKTTIYSNPFIPGFVLRFKNAIQNGDKLRAIFNVKSGEMTLTAIVNDTDVSTVTTATPEAWADMSSDIISLYSGTLDPFNWAGTVDLKQFSIFQNRQPYLSGNQTGIDTIKPDDYTVVGSPTITADGIASGFSNTNYISIPTNLTTAFDVKYQFNLGDFVANSSKSLITFPNGGFYLYFNANSQTLTISYRDSESVTKYDNLGTIKENTLYEIQMHIENFNASFTVTEVTGNTQRILNLPLFYTTYSDITELRLINAQSANSSLDLNTFKMFANGKLIYQPCLKIPYTLTSDGDKIVNAIYADRVQDMYEQFGYAPYYILDQTNDTYSLPVTNQPTLNFNNNNITVNN